MSNSKDALTGKWIVTHEPDLFPSQQVLELLIDIQNWLLMNHSDQPYRFVNINKNHDKNSISFAPETIFIKIRNNDLSDFTEINKPQEGRIKIDLYSGELKKILLLYPAMIADRRWDSIELPTAWLYLGSSLSKAEFEVHTRIIPLPAVPPNLNWNHYDAMGLTLYEDSLMDISEFLNLIRPQYRGLIVAGGPLISLNPLQSAYHLPEINLMIRGESEFILPSLLKAIRLNNIDELFKWRGFLFQSQGTMIISDLDYINQPKDFSKFHFSLDFLDASQFRSGLELNVTRGCNRGCIFCSRVQGRTLRQIPLEKISGLLETFSEKLKSEKIDNPDSRTVNINDDDILQDPHFASGVFHAIKKNHFRLWGVQTSIVSFFNRKQQLFPEIVEMLSDPSLFVKNRPLLWLGTDTFLKIRGKKLAKWIPDQNQIETLLDIFENKGILNYHYWISSDHDSSWEEFIREFLLIIHLKKKFPSFSILAHSPFLIPYSSTPLFDLLNKDERFKGQIKTKIILRAGRSVFHFPLVKRVETRLDYLNKLLSNQSLNQSPGFLDVIKKGDYVRALKTAYDFLKQERLSIESSPDYQLAETLKTVEKKVEMKLAEFI